MYLPDGLEWISLNSVGKITKVVNKIHFTMLQKFINKFIYFFFKSEQKELKLLFFCNKKKDFFSPDGEPVGVIAPRWPLPGCCCCLLPGESVLSSDLERGFRGVVRISWSFCVARLFFGETQMISSGCMVCWSRILRSGREGGSRSSSLGTLAYRPEKITIH